MSETLTQSEIERAASIMEEFSTSKKDIVPSTAKGLTFYSHKDRLPFEGMSIKQSDRFRKVLAARYGGFSNAEACTMGGTTPSYMSNLINKYPDQWNVCHSEIQAAVVREHHIHAGFMTAAMSEYCPEALKVLYTLMMDKKQSGSLRAKIAKDIMDMGMTRAGGRDLASEIADQLSDTLKDSLPDFEPRHIIDVTEKVTIDED